MFRKNKIVPAVMFHSVGLENLAWTWSHISEPIELFESKIKFISENFNTIFWNDLYQYMNNELDLPKNSILLTFDDGYLDNWLLVYPIIKKYGVKITIFVNPDFVDNKNASCRTLKSHSAEDVAGFLNWQEMREMEKSGLVDIQSHAMSHTWFFSGPSIVDFYADDRIEKYPWIRWNTDPDNKPFYLTDFEDRAHYFGSIVLEHKKSLTVKRFFPDQEIMMKLKEFIVNTAPNADWHSDTLKFLKQISTSNTIPGIYETDAEQQERFYEELSASKEIIEQNLHKSVDFLCWPGGGNSEELRKLAVEIGYKSCTLGSQDESKFRNIPGANAKLIKRIGSVHKYAGSDRVEDQKSFILKTYAHQGSFLARVLFKLHNW